MIGLLYDALVAALLLTGAAFALIAAIGLVRLPDLFTRMHAASKAGTLGSGVLLIALAGVVFFLLTAPISAHLLAKAAYAVGYGMWEGSVRDEMRGARTDGDPEGTMAGLAMEAALARDGGAAAGGDHGEVSPTARRPR